MYSPGTKLTYSTLDIEFIVDEELQSWKNIYNWMLSMADPDGFEKRDGSRELQDNKHFSDATLTVLSGLNNPVIRIQYTNLFPLSISDIEFNTKESADTVVTCRATFRYQSYNYLTT
jgi:virulence-associated protein VapD